MKASSILKELAVLCYFFIFLQGSMVSLPMFVFLLITIADFGTTEQIFSAIAIVGILIHFFHPNFRFIVRKLVVDAFVFACMLSPLAYRMSVLPFERFRYNLFLVPAIGFVVLYLAALGFRFRDAILHKPEPIIEGDKKE